jgi:DMSO reductase anchor subunit
MGALLVGGTMVVAGKVVKGTEGNEGEKASEGDEASEPGLGACNGAGIRALSMVSALLVLALLVVESLRLVHLGTTGEAAAQTLDLLCGQYLGLSIVRWAIGLVVPAALMFYAWLGKAKAGLADTLVVASLFCLLAGEAISRVLFFMTAVHIW